MLQPRRHHVWIDQENPAAVDGFSRGPAGPKGFSKTPGPSRKPTLGAQKGLAMTTGLRGNARVLSKENKGKGKGEEDIEPQRLFKEVLLPPTTAKRNALLLDKTNTSKKPLPSSSSTGILQGGGTNLKSSLQQLAKTPGPKKSVRLAPQTPAAGPVGGKGKARQEEDEAFRTPAPGKRARRPPVLEATPMDVVPMEVPMEAGAEAEAQAGQAFDGTEVPDVEYGPPTAVEEAPLDTCDVVIDLEAAASLFKISGPVLISGWEGSAADAILAEAQETKWEPEDNVLVGATADDQDDLDAYIILDPAPRAPAPDKLVAGKSRSQVTTAAAARGRLPVLNGASAAPKTRIVHRPPLGRLAGSQSIGSASRPRPLSQSTSTPQHRLTAPSPALRLEPSSTRPPVAPSTERQKRRRAAQDALQADVDDFLKSDFGEADAGQVGAELEGFRLEL